MTLQPSFATEPVTAHATRILMPFGDCVYLVKGHDRAMLLDTGYGIGDLRAAVQNLTDGLEINVLLSHGHVDHVGGAAQFDHVYLNTADEPVAHRHGEVGFRLEFLTKTLPQQLAESGLERADLVGPKPLPYDSVSDGDQFDLGGVTVVVHAVPGHTPGMLVPVIVEDRVAVFGDACGENTLLCLPESLCVMEYAESLRKLRGYEDEWDIVVRNHGTHQSPTSILARNLELAERILAGTDDMIQIQTPDGPALMASVNHGPDVHGNIVYKVDDPRGF